MLSRNDGPARFILLSWAIVAAAALSGAMPPMAAQQSNLTGTWNFVRDSDGSVPAAGASITITFSGAGGATLKAVGPGQNITDSGTYSISGNLISLSLPRLGKSVANRPFTLSGDELTLPFMLFSSGSGSSLWHRPADLGALRGGGGAGGGQTGGGGGQTGGGGTPGPAGSPGSQGPGGTAGGGGRGGRSGGGASAAPGFAGTYQGRGAGEEVRFRDRNGLLILTVKHSTEFYFAVKEDGSVEGEGTITYDLTRNTEGLDSLVAGVRGALGFYGGLVGAAAPAGALGATAGQAAGKALELPGLQYDAPHLKNGPELRHFRFTGRLETAARFQNGVRIEEPVRIFLEQTGDFTRPDGKADNQLIAAYEVNRVKEEKPFPCWSPFLKAPATFRKGPGDVWIAEFQEKGVHRNGVKVWEEYGCVWLARQNKP